MSRKAAILRAIIVLTITWTGVWLVTSAAEKRRITAERVTSEISRVNLADQSARQPTQPVTDAEAERREADVRRIADMINRLDFTEREKNRDSGAVMDFFQKLSPREREVFVNLTIVKSLDRFMEALDRLPQEQRQKFVAQGLKALREGKTQEEIARLNQMGEHLLERVGKESMRAYFEKASTETKLDLEPLMRSMKDVMEGLRGNELGPRQ